MPKRSNPFGQQSPLQMKTHVGTKEVDLGVAQEERMKSVYDRTRELLFRGSQKAFTVKAVELDTIDNACAEASATKQLLPGQMVLDVNGHLMAPSGQSEESEMRMTLDEDMAVGKMSCCRDDCLPGQLCIDSNGRLVAASGVSDDKINTPDSAEAKPGQSAESNVNSKDTCYGCRRSMSRCDISSCSSCDKVKCRQCSRRCVQCGGDFCHMCSVINYDEAVERPFCLNCS